MLRVHLVNNLILFILIFFIFSQDLFATKPSCTNGSAFAKLESKYSSNLKNSDMQSLKQVLRADGIDKTLFYKDPATLLSDRNLYYGAKSDTEFNKITKRQRLPLEDGNAGIGLYGVSANDVDSAVNWGGSTNRLTRFTVRTKAKTVDITQGEGLRIWEKFRAKYGSNSLEKFVKHYDIDIIKYRYNSADVFFVKNTSTLKKATAVSDQVAKRIAYRAANFKKPNGNEALLTGKSSQLTATLTHEIKIRQKLFKRWFRERFNSRVLYTSLVEYPIPSTAERVAVKIIHKPGWVTNHIFLQVGDDVYIGNLVWLKTDFNRMLGNDKNRIGHFEFNLNLTEDEIQSLKKFMESRNGIKRTTLASGAITCSSAVCAALSHSTGFKARPITAASPAAYQAYLRLLKTLGDKRIGKIVYVGNNQKLAVLQTYVNGEVLYIIPFGIVPLGYSASTYIYNKGKMFINSESTQNKDVGQSVTK